MAGAARDTNLSVNVCRVATAEQQFQHSRSCQTCSVPTVSAETTAAFVANEEEAYQDEA